MRTLRSDLAFIDPLRGKCQKVSFNKPMQKRRGHSGALVGKYLYVYGGLTETSSCLTDLIRIDLS